MSSPKPGPITETWITEKAQKDEFQFTEHAHKERQEEAITVSDIHEVFTNGKILENYPDDPRGPSCLICGYASGKPIHIVCGKAKNDWLQIITVYIPKLPKWLTPTQRRAK